MSDWLKQPIFGLLLDISGVLKNGDVPIEGSLEAMEKLRTMNIPYRLVTNETQFSKRLLHEQLCKMGFTIPSPEYIVSPAPLLAKYLNDKGLRPYLLVHPHVVEDFDETSKINPNCLVIGDAAEYFNYNVINEAFRFLMQNKSYRFFTLGKGKYYKEKDELTIDVGAFAVALEYATDMNAEIFGKPSSSFFQHALKDLRLESNQVVMIGDDVVGDVKGAQESGIRGVLVKTGKYRDGDESKDGITPDGVVRNLKHAVDQIISIISSSSKLLN